MVKSAGFLRAECTDGRVRTVKLYSLNSGNETLHKGCVRVGLIDVAGVAVRYDKNEEWKFMALESGKNKVLLPPPYSPW